MENTLALVQLMKIPEITACLSLKSVWWLWADPQPLRCEDGSWSQRGRSCPWVRGQERVTVGCWVGSRFQGQGEQLVSWMVSGMKPRELMQLNLHPVFFLVPSLLLWEDPKVSMTQQYELVKMLSLHSFGSCIQLLGGAARRDIPRQAWGWGQSGGVAGEGSVVLQDHSPKQRW